MHTNREDPNIIETKFAIVASKDVELALNDVCCVATSRAWFVPTSLNFIPAILLHIEYMNIIHPLNSIVATEIVNFGVYETTCGGYSGAWFLPLYYSFNPCKSRGIEVKNVI